MKIKKSVNMDSTTNEQENIYNNFMNNSSTNNNTNNVTNDLDKETTDNPLNNSDSNTKVNEKETADSNNAQQYQYVEKQYKTGSLEENTTVTKASAISRFFLIGFYVILIVVGIGAFFMIRSNRYEFYLKEESIFIENGSTYQIELIPKNQQYFDYLNYDYSIANENVATVDQFGMITAHNPGTTTLKISVRPGFLNNKTVKIISEDIDVENVDIAVYKDDEYVVAEYIDLNVNQSVTIKSVLNNRKDINVTSSFTSSNTDVAVVDAYGNVTGKHTGTTVITSAIGGIEGRIVVNVKGEKVPTIINPTTKPSVTNNPSSSNRPTVVPTPKVITNISFQSNKISIKKGSTAQINKIITPEELSNSAVTWKSSNTNIVTVNNRGIVTAVNVGKATISATTTNGKVASCEVTVTTDSVNITRITLNSSSKTIEVGEKYQLTTTISPSTATIRKLIWTSDNESVAVVDQSGLVTGKSAGTTIIMVTSSDGKAVAKCTINVTRKATPTPTSSSGNKVTKVSLGVASQINKTVGDELQLSAAVEPSTIKNYTVIWRSSDTSKATVTNNGLVKLLATGTVDITAEVSGVKTKVTIVIIAKTTAPSATPDGTQFTGDIAKYVSIDKTKITVNKGSKTTFTIKAKDVVGTLFVSSSNKNIATIEYPDASVPICGELDNKSHCYVDGLTGEDTITITVNGKGSGTAYINISTDDIVDGNDYHNYTGSAKIGVLVK